MDSQETHSSSPVSGRWLAAQRCHESWLLLRPTRRRTCRSRTGQAISLYGTGRLHSARSVEDVQAFVRSHDQLKVLGTRHCFNDIADSTHELLSVREMNQIVALDPAARTVTIEAGMSYGQLCPLLDRKGFALHNLASLPHISVAGAAATATHGSGVRNGNLATAVPRLSSRPPPAMSSTFAGRRTPPLPGRCRQPRRAGVVTKVTLDVQPTFQARQDVYLNLPMSAVRSHFDEIASAGAHSVSLFTDWQNGILSEVWAKRRLESGQTLTATPEFTGATLATKNVHPIAELSAENCTEQMGVAGPGHRLPHFRMGFTPSSGKELQSEGTSCRAGTQWRRS